MLALASRGARSGGMKQREQLPVQPVPYPPKNPACDWCGDRPARVYEVEPPVYTTSVVTSKGKKKLPAKVMKKRAKIAYVCRRHEAIFDRQKVEREHGKVA